MPHLAEVVPLYLRNALQRGADELGRSRHSMVDTLPWVYVLGISRTPCTAVTQKSLIEHREDPDRSPVINRRVYYHLMCFWSYDISYVSRAGHDKM